MKSACLISLVILPIVSCKQNKQEYISIDPVLKSLLDFKQGSYWIMQDSVTQQEDSFVVVRYLSYNNNSNTINETINSDILEYTMATKDSVAIWVINLPNGKENTISYNNIKTDKLYRFYPFSPATQSYFYTKYDYLINNYDSVTFAHSISNNSTTRGILDVGVNKKNGFIYLKYSLDSLSRTWRLLRGKKQ